MSVVRFRRERKSRASIMAVRRVRLRGPSEPTPVVFSELDAGVERANSGRDLRLHRAWLAPDRADTLLTAVRATATWTAVPRISIRNRGASHRTRGFYRDAAFVHLAQSLSRRRRWRRMARRPGYPGSVLDIRRKARTSVVLADLDHGDLAIMRGRAQSPLEHRVPKDRRIVGVRINPTFRQLPDLKVAR